jgi:hypothetical protein
MTIVGGFDVHRKQLTFDYVDTETGEVRWGQIRPATRKTLRSWLAEHCPNGNAEFALEGCTGWRYVAEELTAVGAVAHLADPAEAAGLRGPKKRAKSDRTDARLLRTLLWEGRLPESAIPPPHVLEVRTLARLYCALMDERRAWQQRIHAQLFHQGCPPIRELLSQVGRDGLATAELFSAGRCYVEAALRRIDELTDEINPLRTQLVDFAKRQPVVGCCRPATTGWAGCARPSSGPKSATPAGSTVPTNWCASPDSMSPCIPPMANAPPGACPSKAHPRCGGRRSRRPNALPAPARRITPTTTSWPNGPAVRNKPAAKTPPWRSNVSCCAAATTPCASSVMPRWHCRPCNAKPPEMPCARAVPTNHLMPAASSLTRTVATHPRGGRPGKTERPHPQQPARRAPHPHHVAGPRPRTQISLGAGTPPQLTTTCHTTGGNT